MGLEYIKGAAFYLFSYLMVGLANSGILYIAYNWFHVAPVIVFAVIVPVTVVVLFFSFKLSVEFFVARRITRKRLILAWIVQTVSFIGLALGIEKTLAPLVSNPKLFRVLSVFVNFGVFFLTYWLSIFLAEKRV